MADPAPRAEAPAAATVRCRARCEPARFHVSRAARTARRGARLIFDHHDLSPELYRSRFQRSGVPHHALRAIERRALRSADAVISTNESVQADRDRTRRRRRRTCLRRSQRSGPRPLSAEVAPDPALRSGSRHLIAYLGMMGPQDGIDHALRALASLRGLRDDDWHAVFIGSGEVLEQMRALASELGLAEMVEFAGWREDGEIRSILSTADVCLAPDPPEPAQRRLDDDQGPRVHGAGATDRFLRPE